MIALFYSYFKPLVRKTFTWKVFLICSNHSPGNYFSDLLMKDVCILLAASFDSAAPYGGSVHIQTICSKTAFGIPPLLVLAKQRRGA